MSKMLKKFKMNLKLIVLMIGIVMSILISGCVEKPPQNDKSVNASTSTPFFPVQKEIPASYMAALLSDKPEELELVGGCLRVNNGYDNYLLVWPYGSSLNTEGDVIQVIDDTGQSVVRVGDKIKVGGGECAGCTSKDIAKFSAELPSDRCSGPYWIVAEVITVDKSASPVATTTPMKPEISGSEEKMLVVGGTWEKDGWNLSVKAVDKSAAPGFVLISLSYQDKKLEDARIETGKSIIYRGRNPDGSEVSLFTVKAVNIFVGAGADAVRLELRWTAPMSGVQIIEAPVESETEAETPAPTPTAQASQEAPGFGVILSVISLLIVTMQRRKA